ncbi:MAG: response regulator transcription factor [Candidatus Omnitrophica bacterium]|nr:response regulator transcription factor [Candidatus Omnitrophota bacterium]
MNPQNLTVYIVDDDYTFRESLEELTGRMGYKVQGFGSAEDFLKQNLVQRPACLLLDMYLPRLDGFALQEDLQDKGIAVPIIFITGHGDIPMSVKAIKQGAVDFLLKPFNAGELRSAIISAHKLDKQNVKEAAQRARILSLIATLTSREDEVMRQIITGKLNKQIAVTLGTAEKTIRKHRGRVMKKMRLSSVAKLVQALEKVGIST